MQTARVTVLMTPERKAALEARASELGVSSGEYIRLAVDNYRPTEAEEAELAALVEEVNHAIPRMQESIRQMSETLASSHEEVDRLLRDMGLRQ